MFVCILKYLEFKQICPCVSWSESQWEPHVSGVFHSFNVAELIETGNGANHLCPPIGPGIVYLLLLLIFFISIPVKNELMPRMRLELSLFFRRYGTSIRTELLFAGKGFHTSTFAWGPRPLRMCDPPELAPSRVLFLHLARQVVT